jgi:hypothetical protein
MDFLKNVSTILYPITPNYTDKHYFTHDNYNRPFCVYIDEPNNKVFVYKRIDTSSFKLKKYNNLIETFNPDKIFIGKSPLSPMTEFSGGHGPEFDGNSILLKINENEYVFIGDQIYSFKTNHQIVSFVSPVGNNDVPYPYAIDDKDNYYFLLHPDTGILTINDDTKPHDPYEYFYSIKGKIKESENIECMYMGDESYNMITWSNPGYNYDDLIKRLGDKGPMYIQFKGKEKKPISRNDYIELLENYNKKIRLMPLLDIKIIEKRDW